MSRKEFEKIVQEALDSLPRIFRQKLDNIDIVIQDKPKRGQEKDLLGLYEGVPVGDRTSGYSLVLHDRITLFKVNLEKECETHGLELRDEVRHTVLHEIAHHFGMSDEHLDEEGLY